MASTSDLLFYPRGRDALLAALRALAVHPGEAVVVPAYICDSTVAPLRRAGYRIVFVDVEPDFELDPATVLPAVAQSAAKAVLAVHYFGFPAGVGRLVAALGPLGVRVIEDCCHSFLSQHSGQRVGMAGDAAIFSMRKTLPIPDGGALRLNTAEDAAGTLVAAPGVARYLCVRLAEAAVAAIGWPNIYSEAVAARRRSLHVDEVAGGAAPEGVPMPQAPSALLARYLGNAIYLRELAGRVRDNYQRMVDGAGAAGLQPCVARLAPGTVPQWAPFYDDSGQLVPWLRERGVGAARWPWHELPAEVSADPRSYPVSNELNRRVALLPVHQSIGSRQVERMLALLRQGMAATQ